MARLRWFLAILVLGTGLGPTAAHGQADSTEAVPPDSVRTEAPPLNPLPFSPSLYGRPVTDSIPGRLHQAGVEHILAVQPSSFLYDLGTVGWPHGWSLQGFAPHRTRLWLDGQTYNDPLTGRAQFELLPPAFLKPPQTGFDPGGGAVGVHTQWREYARKRPLTELRYRVDNNGLHAIEVGHSQKRRVSLSEAPGVLQITFGFGGRKVDGVYDGSQLRHERRLWGRLRYQTSDWTVELSDRAARHRIGAHGGVVPPGPLFESIYRLPLASASVRQPGAWRRTARNDLTARVRAPLLPVLSAPLEASATWTSHTSDFHSDYQTDSDIADTTWTAKTTGLHARLQQPFEVGRHHLTLTARGTLWNVDETDVLQINGSRGALHALVRDSLRVGRTDLVLDVGGHLTPNQRDPSAAVRVTRPVGPLRLTGSVRTTGQRLSWIAEDGFGSLVQPLRPNEVDTDDDVLSATVEGAVEAGPLDVSLQGFAHRIRNAVDLYAPTGDDPAPPSTFADTVVARSTSTPVRRAGATLSLGWRQDANRGLYATAQGTALQTLNDDASALHTRLAQTLPTVFGRGRIGARFVVFTDLHTDLYVQARGWSTMNSRWFHPPTGRLVVPPAEVPIPATPTRKVGPSGSIDVHAEARIRGATLFFSFENIEASSAARGSFSRRASLHPGTFVVPVYPLPARQFRFGVFWPIFD